MLALSGGACINTFRDLGIASHVALLIAEKSNLRLIFGAYHLPGFDPVIRSQGPCADALNLISRLIDAMIVCLHCPDPGSKDLTEARIQADYALDLPSVELLQMFQRNHILRNRSNSCGVSQSWVPLNMKIMRGHVLLEAFWGVRGLRFEGCQLYWSLF